MLSKASPAASSGDRRVPAKVRIDVDRSELRQLQSFCHCDGIAMNGFGAVLSGVCIKTHQYFVVIGIADLQRLDIDGPGLEAKRFIKTNGGGIGRDDGKPDRAPIWASE